MSFFDFSQIEKKWQRYWIENKTYQVEEKSDKPKYYVLDMFPYPSGSGLHVGHPLGYIAADIYARYKRLKGFNVLHPMGFDSFGLPAEQYAIETGKHPELTTSENISRYKQQLNKIGLSFDWSREVITSDPRYYKWTQWIFIQLFESWYNPETNKAEPINNLIQQFELNGNQSLEGINKFSEKEWSNFSAKEKEDILQHFRLAYLAETTVNWCPALGTVLANDEVKDGFSERGGYPVFQKQMLQWNLRISSYAERLLSGLDKLQWSDSLKEMQKNWIGKSSGSEIKFKVDNSNLDLNAFTTRPDTIYGVSFIVLAPESEYVDYLVSDEHKERVNEYREQTARKSERDRQSNIKSISGVFTGSYAIHPLSNQKLPIWVADYVLAGYGTGVVMAVPAHDDRDYNFAQYFDLPIVPVYHIPKGHTGAYTSKNGELINSEAFNGISTNEAINKITSFLKGNNQAQAKVNYRLRDAIFTRQRYWGEPLPIYFDNDIPKPVAENDLPIELPKIDEFKPTEDGQPPLARAKSWNYHGNNLELSTMPGFAGSSWYFFRYMDVNNTEAFVAKQNIEYWKEVDLYVGGTEHATGHLLYARFFTKVLYDLGYISIDEPFKKLVNQGMIQGKSALIYRDNTSKKFISAGLIEGKNVSEIHVDITLVNDSWQLDIEAFKKWREDYRNAEFELENGIYQCGDRIEKMSKRLHNVVNPDEVIDQYGADVFRMYEMFLGPIEDSKPWNTKGIEGIQKFFRKLWRLFYDVNGQLIINEEASSKKALKALHYTIKKVGEDIENLSLNTSISQFMVCVNELLEEKCHNKYDLEKLVIVLAPFAPHIAEELYHNLDKVGSVFDSKFPDFNKQYLIEDTILYPISINGKVRAKLSLSANLDINEVEEIAMKEESIQKYIEGKDIKKVIVVPKKIVNIVV